MKKNQCVVLMFCSKKMYSIVVQYFDPGEWLLRRSKYRVPSSYEIASDDSVEVEANAAAKFQQPFCFPVK